MTMTDFRKEVEEDIRKRIRKEDFVSFEMDGDEELISVVPFEHRKRMRPYISLTDLYKVYEKGKAEISDIGNHIVSEMAELWQYAIEHDIKCEACSIEEDKFLS